MMIQPDPSNLQVLKNLTASLTGKQELVNQILNGIPDLVVLGRGNGYLGLVNMASISILGWNPEEMTGRVYSDFIHPDDLEATVKIVAEAKVTQTIIVNFVNRYLHKDGSYVTLSWNIKPSNQDGYIYSTARRL